MGNRNRLNVFSYVQRSTLLRTSVSSPVTEVIPTLTVIPTARIEIPVSVQRTTRPGSEDAELHQARKFVRIEAGAADQGSVNVRLPHEVCRIGCLH